MARTANGALTVKFEISSFIATLGTGILLSRFRFALSNGQVIFSGVPEALTYIGQEHFLGLGITVWLTILIALVLLYVTEHTPAHRRFGAARGDPPPASLECRAKRRVAASKGSPDVELLHHAYSVLDGSDERLLKWIEDSGISVLIADNFAVEAFQETSKENLSRFPGLPIHRRCLVELGIHLGELWQLTPLNNWLRAHKRSRFLLTAPPLRLPGSFGSPMTPVATV